MTLFNKVESYEWSCQKISYYCGFDEQNSNTNSTNKNNDKDKSDNAKTAYKVLMSIFICLSAIFLAITIFLGKKISKSNKTHPPIDQNINIKQINITQGNLKNQ